MSYLCKFIDKKGFSKYMSIQELVMTYYMPIILEYFSIWEENTSCGVEPLCFRYNGQIHGIHVYKEMH